MCFKSVSHRFQGEVGGCRGGNPNILEHGCSYEGSRDPPQSRKSPFQHTARRRLRHPTTSTKGEKSSSWGKELNYRSAPDVMGFLCSPLRTHPFFHHRPGKTPIFFLSSSPHSSQRLSLSSLRNRLLFFMNRTNLGKAKKRERPPTEVGDTKKKRKGGNGSASGRSHLRRRRDSCTRPVWGGRPPAHDYPNARWRSGGAGGEHTKLTFIEGP